MGSCTLPKYYQVHITIEIYNFLLNIMLIYQWHFLQIYLRIMYLPQAIITFSLHDITQNMGTSKICINDTTD